MSRTSSRRGLIGRLRPVSVDDGFTLVELMASMVVFALASSAAVGMFVTGIRASLVVRLDTGAKALAQERIELMRNLTYHIPFSPAPAKNPPDFLDQYYTTTTKVAATISGTAVDSGYLTAAQTGPTYRLPGEPQTGAMYRYVKPADPDFPRYRQYVATQFLNDAGTVQAPPAGYDSQSVSPADDPPSPFVGVTITTMWTAGTLSKTYTISSRLSGQPAPARVNVQGRMSAVRLQTSVSSTFDSTTGQWQDPTQLVLTAASIGMDGTMTTGGQAAVVADGGSATLAPGDKAQGALATVSVPPVSATASDSESAVTLKDAAGIEVAALAGSSVSNVTASVPEGLPRVATATTPTVAKLADSGLSIHSMRLSNKLVGREFLRLHTSQPQAFIVNGGGDAATTTGYVTTVAGSTSHKVEAGMTATSRFVSLLPTDFAPNGVVQVRLESASIQCVSSGAGPSVSGTYTAKIKIFDHSIGDYQVEKTIDPSAPLDPLWLGTQVGVAADGFTPLLLADYIKSWSNVSSVAALGEVYSNTKGVRLNVAGLVSIETVPTRRDASLDDPSTAALDEGLDTTSSIGLQLGGVSCIAEDKQ